jgi:hypothetical protein
LLLLFKKEALALPYLEAGERTADACNGRDALEPPLGGASGLAQDVGAAPRTVDWAPGW